MDRLHLKNVLVWTLKRKWDGLYLWMNQVLIWKLKTLMDWLQWWRLMIRINKNSKLFWEIFLLFLSKRTARRKKEGRKRKKLEKLWKRAESLLMGSHKFCTYVSKYCVVVTAPIATNSRTSEKKLESVSFFSNAKLKKRQVLKMACLHRPKTIKRYSIFPM